MPVLDSAPVTHILDTRWIPDLSEFRGEQRQARLNEVGNPLSPAAITEFSRLLLVETMPG